MYNRIPRRLWYLTIERPQSIESWISKFGPPSQMHITSISPTLDKTVSLSSTDFEGSPLRPYLPPHQHSPLEVNHIKTSISPHTSIEGQIWRGSVLSMSPSLRIVRANQDNHRLIQAVSNISQPKAVGQIPLFPKSQDQPLLFSSTNYDYHLLPSRTASESDHQYPSNSLLLSLNLRMSNPSRQFTMMRIPMFLGAKGEDVEHYIRIIQAIFKQEKGVYKTKADEEEE